MRSDAYQEFTDFMKRRAFADASDLAERQSLARGDRNEFWLTQQAKALLRGGRKKKALEIANRALHLAPNNQYALLVRADILTKLGRYKEAQADYRELMNNPRVLSRAQNGILNCLSHKKEWTLILKLIAEWEMEPEDTFMWRFKAFTGLSRRDDAISACSELLKLSPDNPRALWQLAELEIERDGLEEVRKRMARLAKIPSRPPVYREIYASLCRKAGSEDIALEEYDKISEKQSNPRIVRKKVFAMRKSGQEQKAIPLMEELLRMAPKDMYIHKSYIASCKRIGDMERPCKFYRELISVYPDEKTLFGRLRGIEKNLEKS